MINEIQQWKKFFSFKDESIGHGVYRVMALYFSNGFDSEG